MTTKWREFEKLIAVVEEVLTPKGAVVTSPDRILDKVTGTLREVDVLIRYKIGSVSTLLTIECRRRGKRQDVAWIEQLATKMRDTGVNGTIAVASSGFSQAAIAKAHHHGILIRTVDEVDTREILEWIQVKLKLIIYRDIPGTPIFFYYSDVARASGEPPQPAPQVVEALRSNFADAPVFIRDADGHRFTFRQLAENPFRQYKEMLTQYLKGGADQLFIFSLRFLPGEFYIETVEGPVSLAEIQLPFDYSVTLIQEVFPESTRHLAYQDPDSVIADVLQLNFDFGEHTSKLILVKDEQTGLTHVKMEVPSKNLIDGKSVLLVGQPSLQLETDQVYKSMPKRKFRHR